ncbi:MAG: DNA polymerase II large subunit, partial [Nanoarchaeota archaeon]
VKDEKQAKQIEKDVEKILYLGDILFNYGDFSENGHPLVPCGYNEDWFSKELEKTSYEFFGNIDIEKIANKTNVNKETIEGLLSKPNKQAIEFSEAIALSKNLGLPLHPFYTFFWTVIDINEFKAVVSWLNEANVKYNDEGTPFKIILPLKNYEKEALEKLAVPHELINNEFVIIKGVQAAAFIESLKKVKKSSINEIETVLENINRFSEIKIMDKAGTFIGARMGRPEKSKQRKMSGSPHCLFPVGEEGGRLRSFQTALEKGYVEADFILNYCKKCQKYTVYYFCEVCGCEAEKRYFCPKCQQNMEKDTCGKHGLGERFKLQRIDIKHYYKSALKKLDNGQIPQLVKGVRGTSNEEHIPEHLAKGIFRAKHNLYVNKDGTIRFDMSELACTHFKPVEIGTSVEKLRELGYKKDCYGKHLEHKEQIVELKPHDILLPASNDVMDEQSDRVLFRVTKFVDELLTNLYGLKPFYNLKNKDELVGHLVVGLAPHTSAGTVARILGFTDTQGFIAHPLLHAAFRRDCDGDEAAVFMLMDGLLNFSRQYLPNSRGAKTMDAPLVLSSRIIPAEVDDMVHGLDVVWDYPLELYTAAQKLKMPWDVKVSQLKDYLNTEKQYEGYGFTHDVTDLNKGISCSAYKRLPSMEEKLNGQMDLAEKIMAVNESEVARFVIEKHFLKDTKGNLRKFSMQQFRCSKCNEKYRRPPLLGKCTSCGGKLIFTISQGSVIKYLEPSINLSKKYNVSNYLKQSLELLNQRVEEVFGKDKEKQEGLGKWV